AVLTQNKRMMALCWEELDRFSEASRRIIRRAVPFSARLETLSVRQLWNERARWVLKSDYGCEGEEVVIGAETTPAAWAGARSTTASIWWAVARPDCSPACRRGGPIGQRPVHRRWFAPRGGCHERLLVEGLAARAPAGASAGRVDPAGLDGRRQSHPGRLRRGLGGERDGPGAGGVGGAARGWLERGRRRAAAGVSGRAAGRRLGQRGLARCADDAGAAPLARATALAALLRAGAVPVAGGAAQHRPARRHPAGFHLGDGGRLPAWRGAALAVSRQRLLSQRRGAGARRSGAGGGGAGRRA